MFADSRYCFDVVRRHEVYSYSIASKLATVLCFASRSSKTTTTSAYLLNVHDTCDLQM